MSESLPYRMPEGVAHWLEHGTTPQAQVVAEAESCAGDPESFERALARHRARKPAVPAGRSPVTMIFEALGRTE